MSEAADPSQISSSTVTRIVPDPARMEAMAEFAAGAGHEINNPLATIIGRAQQLLKDETNPQRRQMLHAIGAQAYRIRDMIGDAMLFGRPPRPEFQEVDLSALVAKVLAKHQELLNSANCRLTSTLEQSLILRADPAQLAIVISALIRNSCQAMTPNGGTIEIRASCADNGCCQIEIQDQGRGFSDQERIHAFDPFFSGRQAGRGLGFGLPKCWQIVRQHGGDIEIEPAAQGQTNQKMTIVRLLWPIANKE